MERTYITCPETGHLVQIDVRCVARVSARGDSIVARRFIASSSWQM
jgi:hypothetical protein